MPQDAWSSTYRAYLTGSQRSRTEPTLSNLVIYVSPPHRPLMVFAFFETIGIGCSHDDLTLKLGVLDRELDIHPEASVD